MATETASTYIDKIEDLERELRRHGNSVKGVAHRNNEMDRPVITIYLDKTRTSEAGSWDYPTTLTPLAFKIWLQERLGLYLT